MSKYVVLAAVLFISAGCISPMSPIKPVHLIVPASEQIQSRDYEVGKLREQAVGEAMVTRVNGRARFYEGFKASRTFQAPEFKGALGVPVVLPAIRQGSAWALFGTSDAGDKIYSDLVPGHDCIVSDPTGQFYGHTSCGLFYVLNWPEKVPNLLVPAAKFPQYEPGALKQELVYNGRTKDSIKILYREFSDDLVRPAFTQELSYDLADRAIGFRGLGIEIFEATNSKIKYRVTSDFN